MVVKKWLVVGTLLGFGLLFFVLPILVGLALERGFPLVFDDLEERAEGRFALEASLDRGLLDSTGEILIRMVSPGLDAAPLRLRHAWAHGPLPLSEWWAGRIPIPPVLTVVRIEVDPEGIAGPEWLAALAGRPLAQAAVRVNFDGTLDVEASTPAFATADGQVTSEGMRGELTVQGGIRGARGKLDMGAFGFREGDRRLRVESAEVRFHGIHNDAGSRVEGSFEVGAARLGSRTGRSLQVDPSQGIFSASRAHNELDDSSFTVEFGDARIFSSPPDLSDLSDAVHVRGGHLEFEARSGAGRLHRLHGVFSVNALAWGEATAGPGLVRVELKGMDLFAAADFSEALGELDASGVGDRPALEAEAQLLREWFPVLVADSPELEVKRFELETKVGRIEGEGWLRVDGSDPSVFAEEMTALAAIEGRGQVALPVPLMQRWLEAFLTPVVEAQAGGLPREEIQAMTVFLREMAEGRLLETGMLRLKDERYHAEFRFEQGVPIVNGKLLGPGGLTALLTGS
jgi:hypothetical protein